MFVGEGAITKRGFQRRSSSSLMVACTTLPRILKSIRYAFDWYTVATAITARGSRTRSCTRLTVTSISTSPFPTPPCSLPRYTRELQLQLQLPCIGQATAERYARQTAERTAELRTVGGARLSRYARYKWIERDGTVLLKLLSRS